MVASEKGVVVGRLSFREDGDLIDCQRMGVGGKAIPPNVDKVRVLRSSLAWSLCMSQASLWDALPVASAQLSCDCSA